jgi:colanic acid biosynthesis glycosyl transferase WcaI
MRILILSQNYYPEPIPKPSELAVELKKRGHEVVVLTGFPNYPRGKLYPGYHLRFFQREFIDGIPVFRTFEFPYHGKSMIGRFLNYGSFMISSLWGFFCLPAFDVIYVWHPPLSIGVAAWLLARLRRVRFVYDVQDIWPESAVLSGILKDGSLIRYMSKLEKFVYSRANHILVVTDGARENLIGKGVLPQKVSALPHWVDDQIFVNVDSLTREKVRSQFGWNNHFIFLFAGNLGTVQGLDTLLDAAERLHAAEKVRIVFIGDGSDRERLQALAKGKNLMGSVQFVSQQPQGKMPEILGAADALIVHLKESEISKYVIPTKTLAYLASGRPILMAMDGAAAQMVQESGAGVVIPSENPEQMAKAMRLLVRIPLEERSALGKRGRAYLLDHLTKQKVIPRYEAILQKFARPQGKK